MTDPTNYDQYTAPVQQANFKINAVHDTEEYLLRVRLAAMSNEYEVVIPGSVNPSSFHIKHGDQMWETISRRPVAGSGHVRVWTGFGGYVIKKSILLGVEKYSKEWCERVYKTMCSEIRFVGFAATESNLKDGSISIVEQNPTVWCGGQCQITNNSSHTITRGTIISVRPPKVIVGKNGEVENYTTGRNGETHQVGIPYKKITGIIEPVIPEHFVTRSYTVDFMKALLSLDESNKGRLMVILNDKSNEYGTSKSIRDALIRKSSDPIRKALLDFGNAHMLMLNNQCARSQGNARKGELLTIQILQVQI